MTKEEHAARLHVGIISPLRFIQQCSTVFGNGHLLVCRQKNSTNIVVVMRSTIKDWDCRPLSSSSVMLLSGEKSTKLAWTGPSTRHKHGKEPFPKDQKCPLVLGGLAGLAVYIKHQSKSAIKDFEHSKRNELAHNGPFLQSIYQSPDETTHFEQEFVGQKKESVKRLSMTFKDEAEKEDNFRQSIQEGVSLVVAVAHRKTF